MKLFTNYGKIERTENETYEVVNEITIMGSRCGPFEPGLELLNKGLVDLPEIGLWQLKDYKEAFASKAFKVGFDFR